ncbi:MAG: putative primase/helicase [Methanolobus sp.]|nr:putative primase/helicase [Methanolobus sp.]
MNPAPDTILNSQRTRLDQLQAINKMFRVERPLLIKAREGGVPEGAERRFYEWLYYKDIWSLLKEPIYTRGILVNEIVFDPDTPDYDVNREENQKIKDYLDSQEIPYELAYSGGKACHLHIFLAAFDIDSEDLDEARQYDVDLFKCARETIAKEVLKNAGANPDRMGLDWGKIKFTTKGGRLGSMIREYGTTRHDGKYKTLVDEIPQTIPDHLPLRFPGNPKLWNISGTIYHEAVRKAFKEAISRARTRNEYNFEEMDFAGTDLMEFPCMQKIRGLKNGRYYATLSAMLLSKKCGYSKERTEKALVDITSSFTGLSKSDQELRVRNAMKAYDSDYHFSCTALKDKVGVGVCDYSVCPLKNKISAAKDEREQADETYSLEQIKAMGARINESRLTINVPEDHFLNNYVRWMEGITDAYPDYSYCAGLWLLSACTQNKVRLELQQTTVYPNLWFIILGLSSVSRKTTVLSKTRRVYESCTGEVLYNDDYSLEGYLELLQNNPNSNFVRDECTGLLQKMHKKYNDGIFDLECQVYDCEHIRKTLASDRGKKREVVIDGPFVTKLYGTTPDNFSANMTVDDMFTGYGPRFLFCHPKYKKSSKPLELATDEDRNAFAKIVSSYMDLYDKLQAAKEIQFSAEPAAMQHFDSVNRQMEQNIIDDNDNTLSVAWARGSIHAFKIAMLLELGKRTPSYMITLKSMTEACRIVIEYFIPQFMDVIGRLQEDIKNNQIEKVRNVLIKNNGTMQRNELLRYSRLKKKDYDDVVETMLTSGEILEVQENGSRKTWYVLQDDKKDYGKLSRLSHKSHESHNHIEYENTCDFCDSDSNSHNVQTCACRIESSCDNVIGVTPVINVTIPEERRIDIMGFCRDWSRMWKKSIHKQDVIPIAMEYCDKRKFKEVNTVTHVVRHFAGIPPEMEPINTPEPVEVSL